MRIASAACCTNAGASLVATAFCNSRFSRRNARRAWARRTISGCGREGGTRARRAALAFDARDQRRLLAADEGARAQPYVDVEAEAGAGDAVAQQAHALGLLDGRLEVLDGQRVLGAHVDVALLCAH